LLTQLAFGSDAVGVLHPVCAVTNYQGYRLEKPIQFKVIGESGLQVYANQWVDSPREDSAKSSRVQIVQVSRHWWRTMEMSGNFESVFEDGRKFE
jgi:hypothetical protein